MDESWCCEGLSHSFGERRDCGVFVYAEPPGDLREELTFFIAMRSVDVDRLHELLLARPRVDLPITLNTRRRIHHCPWCGRHLARFYRRRVDQVTDEALSRELGG